VGLKFHKRVRLDLDEILQGYYKISEHLGDDFFAEFRLGLDKVAQNPGHFHFDRSGLRRCNLERFPYHFLYDIRGDEVRIWVLRHNRRDPNLGLKRFAK
jgi:plasmid stabilization system protein ParE